jgi:hypothetical protein
MVAQMAAWTVVVTAALRAVSKADLKALQLASHLVESTVALTAAQRGLKLAAEWAGRMALSLADWWELLLAA